MHEKQIERRGAGKHEKPIERQIVPRKKAARLMASMKETWSMSSRFDSDAMNRNTWNRITAFFVRV
jgi:hypothetical protein